MKRYEITIKPRSGFGTPLKGDTLFGHFCWQVANQPKLVEGGLEAALGVYSSEPFAVFSSAIPKFSGTPVRYILKRPDLPLHLLFRAAEKTDRALHFRELKNRKSKKWMIFEGDLPLCLDRMNFCNDHELAEFSYANAPEIIHRSMDMREHIDLCQRFDQPHNTINRLTGTTGKGAFAPYNTQNICYAAGTELAIIVLLNNRWTDIERVVSAIADIGRFGFGRDASIGMGRFDIAGWEELTQTLPAKSEGVYTLAPCVPGEKEAVRRCRFSPFTRFGRHGDRLAVSINPFKTPVIMADEGAVFLPNPDMPFVKFYVGMGVTGVSKVQPTAVVQGYAPYLPIRLENKHE